ncbi:MAG: glycosyltransferase family 39 protein [Phycisphaerae bacterium]|nr:glycosyltransferase family 39 protein [Phycisphaerae bacterium]
MPSEIEAGPGQSRATARATLFALVLILIGAGALRLPALDTVPPGLNQDEACNAWNAYCLLKTGRDQFGVPWPIFYTRALGENRSTLFLYWMRPFQAVCGLSIWATRLPAAAGGLLTILLMYWVGARLFDRGTGLAAAALLAANPIHIQMTRWGHEASLTPLLTLLPLAGLLWAGLWPATPAPSPATRGILRALLAGLLTGVCCYGYPAVRLFVPVFLLAVAAVTWRGWWPLLRERRGRLAVLAWVVGFVVTFGPLAYVHVAEPHKIARRGDVTWAWLDDDPPATRVAAVLVRYISHFSPDVLFWRGDEYDRVWTPRTGFMPRYTLPLLIAGAAVCGARLGRGRAASVLLAAVLLYPVADCLNWHVSLQALRSSAGLWALVLLAALGISGTVGWLRRQRLTAYALVGGVALLALATMEGRQFWRAYAVERSRDVLVRRANHADLVAACAWLRSRLADVDAVVCTTEGFNQPYVITVVALGYSPEQWFAEPRVWEAGEVWDHWSRYGKLYFAGAAERAALLDAWRADGREQRVLLLVRPGEPVIGERIHRIQWFGEYTALEIYEARL